MTTKPKIKIVDNEKLRFEIDKIYEQSSQVIVVSWAIKIAKHILNIVRIDYRFINEIVEGFDIVEQWKSGKVIMHELRQAGFKIHKLAREVKDDTLKNVYRVIGQAVSSGHMKEHAIVASDYAVKVIGLLSSNSIESIEEDRQWQLQELMKLIE
jgi:hypothetical protein